MQACSPARRAGFVGGVENHSCAAHSAWSGAQASSNAATLPQSHPALSAIYAPDVACNFSTSSNAPSALSLEVVSQRAAQQAQERASKPAALDLVERTLEALPQSHRKRLVDGLAKQVDAWATNVGRMPKSITGKMLAPFCSGGSTQRSGLVGSALAAASDALDPRAMVAAIVGDKQAAEAAAKACRVFQPDSSQSSSWRGRLQDWLGDRMNAEDK
jgi:hypothetical protein